MKDNRIRWIDIARGITIISMVFYHALWDVVFIYHHSIPWYTSLTGYIWQQSICWSFIFLAGYCWSMSRHPLRRGIELGLFGLLITAVTYFFLSDNYIIFGILFFMSIATLSICFLDSYLKRIPSAAGAILSFLSFIVTKELMNGYIGIKSIYFVQVPDVFYSKGLLSALFGFKPEGFFSSDYFPFIPWIFLYIMGYYIKRMNGNTWLSDRPFIWWERFLSFLGRHSLFIYLIHQPVIYIVLFICRYLQLL